MTAASLLVRAARLLRRGPLPTLEVAREVLGLSGGHPGAAASAVFALLGPDPRFRVDGEGIWSLDGAVPTLRGLREMEYAVVDVETTGGSPDRGHRITEIALVEITGGAITGEFHTLVNPGRTIPGRITALTGITDGMVAGAPFFDELAEEIFVRLRGRVFVAHNASFDWRFVGSQLADSLGDVPEIPRLCTVRLARRLLRTLRRRNLVALAQHFGISVQPRHRASGDALATARIFLRLLDEAEAQGLRDFDAVSRLQNGTGPRPGEGGSGRG